jgi:nucleoside-diphosphate-sugar epimerase
VGELTLAATATTAAGHDERRRAAQDGAGPAATGAVVGRRQALSPARPAGAQARAAVGELLYRRADLVDIVQAHRLALERAPAIGFGRYIISATTPFTGADLAALRTDAPAVVARLFPAYPALYEQLGWSMFPDIERVYDNARARADLGWAPRWDFGLALERLAAGQDPFSELTKQVGTKGYHAVATGVYTTRAR